MINNDYIPVETIIRMKYAIDIDWNDIGRYVEFITGSPINNLYK